jgi:catechol-2,3-dioxygenase
VTPNGILETILYASDLVAIEQFYRDVLGLEPVSKAPDRQVFYRVGEQMLLIFNPAVTVLPPKDPKLPVPAEASRS